MSGICGIVQYDGDPVGEGAVRPMIAVAAHRGPDGVTLWHGGGVTLAHLARHVTPEDRAERQPLTVGDFVLVADARIDARDDLVAHIGPPVTATRRTDVELILAAHERWGDDAPAHLLGDYAYVLYDTRARRLFAARDRLGMRSLSYRAEERRFMFATDVAQILAAPDVPVELDEGAVHAFLREDHERLEETPYVGIRHLRPGDALVADAAGVRTWRFWDPDPETRVRHTSLAAYGEHFVEVFEGAVRDRLRSFRPQGTLLSGGMDSGSLASVAGRLLEREPESGHRGLRTYSWAFERLTGSDERHVSDHVVARFGLSSTPIPAEEHAPLMDWPRVGPDRDEPYLNIYAGVFERALEQAGRDGVTSMLASFRADLVAGGYVLSYPGLVRAGRWRALAHELRAHAELPETSYGGLVLRHLVRPLAGRARRALVRTASRAPRGTTARIDWLREAPVRAPAARNPTWRSDAIGPARANRYGLIFYAPYFRSVGWSERTHARYGQVFLDPWADRRLVEFALAIPQQVMNLPGTADKRMLRAAMRGIMPEAARLAAGKRSPVPLYRQALEERSTQVVDDLLTGTRLAARGFVDEGLLRDHYARIRAGEKAPGSFWNALALEMWLRRHWS
ncbi:MAG: hypothetical protein H0U69_01945 [Trueperaceae bacterium]|nr:hypothetical protein [Trueperaceae bacterium]